MDQTISKIDESHDERRLRMAGTRERDLYMRTFPNPMPGTHVLHYEWENADANATLIIRPEKKKAAAAKGKPAPEEDPHTDARAKVAEELLAKSREDLLTLAAERGVKTDPKWTKAQLVAAIAEKLAPAKAESSK